MMGDFNGPFEADEAERMTRGFSHTTPPPWHWGELEVAPESAEVEKVKDELRKILPLVLDGPGLSISLFDDVGRQIVRHQAQWNLAPLDKKLIEKAPLMLGLIKIILEHIDSDKPVSRASSYLWIREAKELIDSVSVCGDCGKPRHHLNHNPLGDETHAYVPWRPPEQ